MRVEHYFRSLILIGNEEKIIKLLNRLNNWRLTEKNNNGILESVLINDDNEIWLNKGSCENRIVYKTRNVLPQDKLDKEKQPKSIYDDLLFELYKDIHNTKEDDDDILISISLSDYELNN